MSLKTLIGFAVIVLATTAFLVGIVIVYEPPAFFGYIFGAFSGALWLGLCVLICEYAGVK